MHRTSLPALQCLCWLSVLQTVLLASLLGIFTPGCGKGTIYGPTNTNANVNANANTGPDAAAGPCSGVTCSGHGTCGLDASEQPHCVCDSGFVPQGLECVAQSDPCAGVTCSGHGSCALDGSNQAYCQCDVGFEPQGLECVPSTNPCAGVTCSGHGTCSAQGTDAVCSCDSGFVPGGQDGLECLPQNGVSSCTGVTCSGHGTCIDQSDGAVCACSPGYTPSGSHGLDCVPTSQICVGGSIDYDVDGDGVNETHFEPNADECEMYEIVNYTRATHDDEGTPECHKPLGWNVLWAAHGRNHSYQMQSQGGLFHDDFPSGQNCAYGCDAACEINMYMNGSGEGHCPPLSHHCNIMRCSFSQIGIGTVGTWNTQNFL